MEATKTLPHYCYSFSVSPIHFSNIKGKNSVKLSDVLFLSLHVKIIDAENNLQPLVYFLIMKTIYKEKANTP